MMDVSHGAYKKFIRYVSNRYYLSSLSPPFPLSLSFSPRILNPSFFFAPLSSTLHSTQHHTSPSLYTSSTGSPSDCSVTPSFPQTYVSLSVCCFNNNCSHRYPACRIDLLRPHCLFRWFSDVSSPSISLETVVSEKNGESKEVDRAGFHESGFRIRTFDGLEQYVTPRQVSEIIEVIRDGGNDLDIKLNLAGSTLSVKSIKEIFRVLNRQRISGLHFFRWVRDRNPKLHNNSIVCSLIIDNCGWLDDYTTMISLLKDFTLENICLTKEAFGFLPVLCSSNASITESIRKMIDVLNEVGGSCRGSGIVALIKILCELDSFETAKFVIETTERKASYYHILILDQCKRCNIEEVHGLLEEMRQLGCDPSAKTYNYLLSSLCRNDRIAEAGNVLEEMLEKGGPPDALSFEIFIYFSCRLGNPDAARQFLDQMVSRDLRPRLSTHAAFVKGYFCARQYEEAHKYVVDASAKYEQSSHSFYSSLASLHQKKGDFITVRNVLVEMMEKGLKPKLKAYARTMKWLHKTGMRHLAGDLKHKFSQFRIDSSTTTG